MQQIPFPSAEAKQENNEARQTCAIAELLDSNGVVYSYADPLYRLALRIGMLRPVRCKGCREWVLVEVEPERSPVS